MPGIPVEVRGREKDAAAQDKEHDQREQLVLRAIVGLATEQFLMGFQEVAVADRRAIQARAFIAGRAHLCSPFAGGAGFDSG